MVGGGDGGGGGGGYYKMRRAHTAVIRHKVPQLKPHGSNVRMPAAGGSGGDAGGRGWCGSAIKSLRPLRRESRQQVRKQGDDGSRQEVGGFNGFITGKAETNYSKY